MLDRDARAVFVSCLLLLAGCGGQNSGTPMPDGGTGGSGGNAGTGGSAGTAGGSGSGGSGASGGTTGGSGGTGGANPGDSGTGPYVTRPQGTVSKIDVLFMIDNSSSMADKQLTLGDAVPGLVDRLIEPKCVDPVTGRVVGNAVNGVCAVGVLDFVPVKDIHIGIITSSLGNHGASGVCEDAIDVMLGRTDPHNNDQAHLISRGVGGPVPTYLNKGFLNYNPAVAGALATSAQVASSFTDMVKGVGQHGCGYEASLEAVYRFLIDPDPYATIRIDTSTGGYGQALLNGTDVMLLQQRADFLRPDSLVTVVLVTDENDCSIIEGGQGFYPILPPVPGTGRSVLKPGTSACATNPNDKCCYNCGQLVAPAGCPDPSTDPQCQKGELLVSEDQPNLRCFDQKRRYGVDFLYPVQRYVDGLTQPMVPNRKGEMVQNPLFADLTCKTGTCPSLRDQSLVLVAGVVGVPWQDIAVDPSDLSKGYKTAKQLDDDAVWADIVGDPLNPSGPIPPRDSHMIESIKPRAGLPGPGASWNADPKNGHEWDPSKDMSQPNADLQYACIFPLSTPKICDFAADCDCFGPNLADTQNPLCQNAQGAYTTMQLRAKAYPGPRILQTLRGLGNRAVVGSICPAQMIDKTRDDYGYAPVVNAIVNRARPLLRGACLSVALPLVATSGQVPCAVVEAFNAASCACDSEPGRRTARASLLTDAIKGQGNCFCEIMQLTDNAQHLCRSATAIPDNTGDGWCYVDPAQSMDASCDLVQACAMDQKRRVRFLTPNSEPRPGATAFLSCDAMPIAPLPNRCP